MRQSSSRRGRPITGRCLKSGAQPAAIVFMVVNQVGYARTAMLVGQEEFSGPVLLYMVMLRMCSVPENFVNLN